MIGWMAQKLLTLGTEGLVRSQIHQEIEIKLKLKTLGLHRPLAWVWTLKCVLMVICFYKILLKSMFLTSINYENLLFLYYHSTVCYAFLNILLTLGGFGDRFCIHNFYLLFSFSNWISLGLALLIQSQDVKRQVLNPRQQLQR